MSGTTAHRPVPRSPVRSLVTSLLAVVPRGRGRLALSVLLAALASGASVALMGVSGWLLSRAAEHPPVLYLEAAAVGVRFFGISRAVFRYLERLVGHDLALRMETALRLRAYDRLSRTTLLGGRRGDLLVRLVADVEAIEDVVVRVVVPACAAALVVVGTSAMIALFSPASASLLMLSALLAGVVLPWLAGRASRRTDAAAVELRGALAQAADSVAHAGVDIVVSGQAAAQLARFDAVSASLQATERRAAWTRGVATAGQLLCAGLAVTGALAIGGRAVASGHLLGRDLAVLVLTPLALHEVFGSFTQAAQTFTRARASLGRVQEVLDAPPVGVGDQPMTSPQKDASTDLVVHHLSAGWPGAEPVVVGLDLRVRPGDSVALMGPSGVGKTTVAATVMGLIPPKEGRVDSPGSIGYLAQDAHVFATTVAENVRIGRRDATDDEIVDALAAAGLHLDPARVIGEQGSTLSGGEARRLALARVLVGLDPSGRDEGAASAPAHDAGSPRTGHRAVILDEPTEHLDRDTADALMDDLWAALRRHPAPLLVITHDPAVAARCTRTVSLGDQDPLR